MFVAFFESIKYVGHLFPLAFLRIFIGYSFILQALAKYRGDFLFRPRIAEQISEALPLMQGPEWIKNIFSIYLVPEWRTLAFIILGIEFAIAISYLIGYVVRPMAILAALYSLFMFSISSGGFERYWLLLIGINLSFAWLGAGRCVGFDYYFFKRRRGLWW